MSAEWRDLHDRSAALVQQSATDPLTIAQTLHHLSMLSLELTDYIGRENDGLLAVAADALIDYEAARTKKIDDLMDTGLNITRARLRAQHQLRDTERAAQQADRAADYAKGVLAAVNRRHFELMNVGKHVDSALGGRRG